MSFLLTLLVWNAAFSFDGNLFLSDIILAGLRSDSLWTCLYVVASLCCVLVAWQVISLEGWVDIMYNIQDAHSFWSWIYFATLIVVSASRAVLTGVSHALVAPPVLLVRVVLVT